MQTLNTILIKLAVFILMSTAGLQATTIEGKVILSDDLNQSNVDKNAVVVIGAFYAHNNFAMQPSIPDFATFAQKDLSFSLKNLPDSTFYFVAWIDSNWDQIAEGIGAYKLVENKPTPVSIRQGYSTPYIIIRLQKPQLNSGRIQGRVMYQGEYKFNKIVIMAVGAQESAKIQSRRFFLNLTTPGKFHFENLPGGSYYIFALIDINNDFEEEALGFYHDINGLPKAITVGKMTQNSPVQIQILDQKNSLHWSSNQNMASH